MTDAIVKTTWIPGLAADLVIVAAWALAGWAAHQSITESDARRASAVEAPALHAQQQQQQQHQPPPPPPTTLEPG